jgi:hypothetical protein
MSAHEHTGALCRSGPARERRDERVDYFLLAGLDLLSAGALRDGWIAHFPTMPRLRARIASRRYIASLRRSPNGPSTASILAARAAIVIRRQA